VKPVVHPPPSNKRFAMSATPVMACLALGANLGDALVTVQQAFIDVGRLPETQLIKASSFYRTAP
jgi:2-amino-4-hydroxy-6-hydroxymethyldihydropteridine diphosphokinase